MRHVHALLLASLCSHLLQDEQASFVVRCVHQLRSKRTSTSGGSSTTGASQQPPQQQPGSPPEQQQPFRLLLVGYSMGGLVAREALRRLAADPSFGEQAGAGRQGAGCACWRVLWLRVAH